MSKWGDGRNDVGAHVERRLFGPRGDVIAEVNSHFGSTIVLEAYIDASANLTQAEAKRIAKRAAKRLLKDVLAAERGERT